MMTKRLLKSGDGTVIAQNAVFAVSPFERMRGMIGRKFASVPFDAMVFERCSAIHCCWMSEEIDVMFVSDNWEVVKVCSRLKPWRFAAGGRNAAATVELPAGTLGRCKVVPGDRLVWK